MDVLAKKPSEVFHLFRWKDDYFLFDPSTHSLFSADSDLWKSFQQDEWNEALLEVFQEARSQGFFQKELPFVEKIPDKRCLKSLCLMVTRKCNFACKYCFEMNQPDVSEDSIMSFETAQKALHFLIEHSGARKTLEIDFFGGEPLLDFSLIREVVRYARSLEGKHHKRFLFSLTTNASLLNDTMVAFFSKEHLSLILSLDGGRESNDLFRVDHHGKGTYDRTLKGILDAIPALATGYYVRGTYTHRTLHFSHEISNLYQEGIQHISFEPVASDVTGIAIEEHDLPQIRHEYELLADWFVTNYRKDPSLRFYHFELDLEKSLCYEKLMSGCGAGIEYLSISPDGGIFPCHQFDGRKEYCLGNLDSGIQKQDLQDCFQQKTLLSSRPECQVCWAKTLCGGGCIANHLFLEGHMDTPWQKGCSLQKIRLEAALYVQAKLKEVV
jgi:uncharacterized protein